MAANNSKLGKQIKKSNKKFDKMTREQKAVAIAKDVLKHLRYTNFNNSQHYCEGVVKLPVNTNVNTNMQPHVNVLRKCNVCAIGGMFLSYIHLFDQVVFSDVGYLESSEISALPVIHTTRTTISDKLQDIFSSLQLGEIEEAFERRWVNVYPEPKDRVKAIMNNIIKNNGMFLTPYV